MSSKTGICAFCGAEVRLGQGHSRTHPSPADAILPSGCTHLPVYVEVWNRKAYIEGGWHTPGEESPAGILLQDGWTPKSAPDFVRRIVEDENHSSFEYVGRFFPRREASAAALDVAYHQIVEWGGKGKMPALAGRA